MIQERRKSQRSSIFLIVKFRNLKSLQQHSSGITANFSYEGIGLESQSINYGPGEILEIILKDPHSELSVPAEGEVVWRRDRWYKCQMGIKIRQDMVGTKSEISELLSNGNKKPAESPSPDKDNKSTEAINKDEKNDSIDPARSNRSTTKATKMDEAICLGAVERKSTDKKDLTTGSLMRNVKVLSGEKNKPYLKKESRSDSGGIVLKEAFMSTPLKKNRTLIFLLTVVSAVSLGAVALKFDDIKKALPLNIQADQFISSQDHTEGNDVSFIGDDQSKGLDIRGPVESLRLSDDQGIDHASLPKEAKIDVRETRSVNESILHVNDLKETIVFDYNSDIIKPVFQLKIKNIVNAMLASPESIVKIEGHADDIGPEKYNMNLSMLRSLAVKKMLIQKGIDNTRIKVAFWGESNPAAPNHTKSGRIRNRRVEIHVVPAAD